MLAALVVLGAMSGVVSQRRISAVDSATLPEGSARVAVSIREDPVPSTHFTAVGAPVMIDGIEWNGPPVGVTPLPGSVEAGDLVVVDGVVSDRLHRIRRNLVAGTIRVREVIDVVDAGGPLFAVGNWLRRRVRSVFGSEDAVDGLVTGLLIGDTERVPATTMEDLRRAGLAHFVAVSGSNVALFLGAWWIVGAPLAMRPRLRVAFGLFGLAVFAVVTRWEPSVVRASVMAAVPLLGGAFNIPVDPWMALGTAVTVLVLMSADLLHSVGFLLSAAATAGVLVGAAAVGGRSPKWLWVPVGATVGAQVAVAPIILVVFGTMPLIAPLANLVAAPIVAFTSAVAVGAVGVSAPFVVEPARWGSALVLRVAEIAASGPQLSAAGVIGAAVVAAAIAMPRLRPLGLAGLALVALTVAPSTTTWPTVTTLTALQIGQGDAILLTDPSGRAVLVDGGHSPQVLDRALRRHGVRRVDVLIVTHGDVDHAGGLTELVRLGDVGELWLPDFTDDEMLASIEGDAVGRGITVRHVRAGYRRTVGSLRLEVLSPARRYLSDNDGSIVTLVSDRLTALLPGDIEAVAQKELEGVRPDILVVPHHGSSTTDPGWLRRTIGPTAILSYGPNRYGHPNPEIVELLADAGATMIRTDVDGDVVLPLR